MTEKRGFDRAVWRERVKRVARIVGMWTLFLALPWIVLWKFAPGFSSTTIGNDYTIYPIDGQLEFIWGWSKGMVPLYIPGFGGGNTPAAMTLGQAWHPITWLCALIPQYREGGAEVVVTIFRLIELGLTHLVVYRATRETGLRRLSSFLLSFVVIYNGRMLDSFRYGPSLEGYCGMMLACAAFASGCRRGWTLGRMSLGALAVYLTLVSGHPQWALFATTGAGLFALCLPLLQPYLAAPASMVPATVSAAAGSPPQPGVRPPLLARVKARFLGPPARARAKSLLLYFGGVGAACVVGAVLSCGYLLPFLREFMPQNGDRVNQEYAFTLGYGDTVRGTLSNFFRPLESDVHGAFGGGVVFLALVLSVPILLATRKRFAIGVLAPTLLFAVALLFAMGKATPVHRFMVDHLPLFSSFRTPGRATLWIPPMMLLIGWVTLADLDRPDAARSWMRVPAIAIAGAASLAAMVVFHLVALGQRVGDSTPAAILKVPAIAAPSAFAFFAIGAAMMGMLAVRSPRTRAVSWTLLLVSTVWCAAITLSYGTWQSPRKPTRTLDAIDAHHRKSFTFWGDPGFGLGTRLVSKADAAKIPTKRELGSVVESASFVSSNEEAIKVVKAGIPRNTVVLTSDELTIPNAPGPGAPKSRTAFVNWNRWLFNVNAPHGGVFVFGQPAMNEWRAYVDGQLTPIITANAIFAAVVIEPGEHDIEFRYESKASRLGGLLFFGGLALVIAANGFLRGWRAGTTRRRILWWVGAAMLIGLVGVGGFFWNKGLTPSLNLVEPPAKV